MRARVEAPPKDGRPLTDDERKQALATWHRVAAPDGSTIAYVPDKATGRAIVDHHRRYSELHEWFGLVILAAGGSITVTDLLATKITPSDYVVLREVERGRHLTRYSVVHNTALDAGRHRSNREDN